MAAAFQGSLFDDDLEPAPAPAPASATLVAASAPVEEIADPEAATAVVEAPMAAEVMQEEPVAAPAAEGPSQTAVEETEETVPTPVYEFADEIPLPEEPPPAEVLDFSPEAELRAARSAGPAPSAAATPPTPAPEAALAGGPALIPAVALTNIEDRAAQLAELRTQSLTCTRCDLSRTRTNVVFGEGNPNAPLVFVGEGPGENEDATGRPFVGRAGKLLDEVLRRNGMTRDHVYICNVVKCRAADMLAGRFQNRPPSPEEISSCQNWLDEQMRTIKPLVIVCVGGPSANTIIHKGFRITSERGKWFDNTGYAPWAMAVFHPAYILRLDGASYGAALETLVEDIGKARQKVIEVKRQLKEAAQAAPPPRSLFD